jgi:hypothetical protein
MMELIEFPVTLDEWIHGTQTLQAEILRRAVEHWRRRKFQTAGALIWQLHDAYPAISWSLIDFYRRPKLAYRVAKSFFAPVLVSIGLRVEGKEVGAVPVGMWSTAKPAEILPKCEVFAMIVNDTHIPLSGLLTLRLLAGGDEALRQEICVRVVANSNSPEFRIHWPTEASFPLREVSAQAEFIPDEATGAALAELSQRISDTCVAIAGTEAASNNDALCGFDAAAGFRSEQMLVERKHCLKVQQPQH